MNLKKEIIKIIKFAIVGVSTFVLQTALYVLFSRILFSDLSAIASYMLAVALAAVLNYVTHRLWTFADQPSAKGSAQRFILVLIVGYCLNSLLFYFGHHILNIYDIIVIIIVGILYPLYTFLAHRFFTFHHKPKKFFM